MQYAHQACRWIPGFTRVDGRTTLWLGPLRYFPGPSPSPSTTSHLRRDAGEEMSVEQQRPSDDFALVRAAPCTDQPRLRRIPDPAQLSLIGCPIIASAADDIAFDRLHSGPGT